MPRIFYRLLESNPPSLRDFMTYAALGREPPAEVRDDPSFRHRWEGLSVYDTYREARRLAKARKFRRWTHIAELELPDDAPVRCEGPEDHGHWNLYGGDPVFLRDRCMGRVLHAADVEEWPPPG